jgi:sugar fermentation stimulation protein A
MPAEERGTYVLIVSLEKDRTIAVGKLGFIEFAAGTYAYCGSAMAGYRNRIKRHFSREKRLHWHIDYLLEEAEPVGAFLLPGGDGVECSLGKLLSSLTGSEPVVGFGSSDCSCRSHLYRIEDSSIPILTESIEQLWQRRTTAPEND